MFILVSEIIRKGTKDESYSPRIIKVDRIADVYLDNGVTFIMLEETVSYSDDEIWVTETVDQVFRKLTEAAK